MTRTHVPQQATEEHEALLERVALGALAPDAREVLAVREQCDVCRAELAQLTRAQAALESWAERERAEARESSRSGDQHRASVTELLKDMPVESSHAPRPPRDGARHRPASAPVVGALLAATLLVFVLGALYLWIRPISPTTPHFLGESDSRCLVPVGVVDSLSEFRWRWERNPDELFTLSVWNGDDLDPTLRVDGLAKPFWNPSQAELEQLNSRIRYRIEKIGANGEYIGSITGFAQLSSP